MIEIGLATVMFFISVWLFCVGVAVVVGGVAFVFGLIWMVITSPFILLAFILEKLTKQTHQR